MHETRIVARGLAFPEGPTLSNDAEMLYVVNLHGSFLSRLDLRAGVLEREWVTLPDGGVGNGATLGPDGALYVADVAARRIVQVSPDDGAVMLVADRTDTGGPLRGPNDLVFDGHGGLYFTDPAGSWDDPVGCVYHAGPGGCSASLVADGIRFPNGLVLSPDGQTLYVAETARKRILAIDLLTRERHVFASVGDEGGPDGMRLGPDGCLYVALYGDGCVATVSPTGKVLHCYPIPGGKLVTNLCFAPDNRSLYVTEAASHTVVQLFLCDKSETPVLLPMPQ